MKIIAGARNSGKTTELVKLSAETGAYIVTRDHNSARQLIDIAAQLLCDTLSMIAWVMDYD